MQVEVEAGMTVKHMNEYLQRKGLALPMYVKLTSYYYSYKKT